MRGSPSISKPSSRSSDRKNLQRSSPAPSAISIQSIHRQDKKQRLAQNKETASSTMHKDVPKHSNTKGVFKSSRRSTRGSLVKNAIHDEDTPATSAYYDNVRKILKESRDSHSNNSESSAESTGSEVSKSSNTNSGETSAKRLRKIRQKRRRIIKSCKKCKERGTDNRMQTFYQENLPAAVIAVANRMKESAMKRSQEQTKDELNSIMHRVTMAFHHSGNDGADLLNGKDVTSNEIIVYGMPDLDIEREREKRDIRQKIVNMFALSLKRNRDKIDLIRDLDDWLENLKNDEENNEEEIEKHNTRMAEVDTIHKTIINSMSRVRTTSRKLKKIANRIMAANTVTGSSEKSEDSSGKTVTEQEKKLPMKRAFTAQEISDKKQWPMAMKKMIQELEETIRITHQDPNRKLLQNLIKQFKIFSSVIERRIKEFADYESLMAEQNAALQKAINESKKAEEKIKSNMEQLEKFEEENGLLQNKVMELQDRVDKASSLPSQPKKKERRKSVMIPTSEGLAKPNSFAVDAGKEVENPALTTSIAEQIKTRLGNVADENQEVNEENESEERKDFNTLRRHTLAAGQLTEFGNQFKQKRRMSMAIKTPAVVEEDIPSSLHQGEPVRTEADKALIKTLEDTVDSLRLDLADARKVLEDQALKIIELETEASEKEALEQQLEQVELDKKNLQNELDMKLVAYQGEIDSQQKKSNDLSDSLEEMKNKICIKDDQIAHLQRCLDTATADVQVLLDEKLALEQKQQNQTVKIEIEGSMTKQQMLIKLKNQYELELQRLRDFLAKEHQRYLAEIRKNAAQHQNDINMIHKGSMLLLKAVNRFKDSVALALERESLTEAASELRQLEPLPAEASFATSSETKQLLSKLAYQATELLVSLENKLSKALLSKRLEVKEMTTARGFILKDLDNHMDKLRKSKQSEAIQGEKLKKIDDMHASLINDYQELHNKYKALQRELAPYQELINSHMMLKKEMERLQLENKEIAKQNSVQITEIEKDRVQLQRVVQSQQEIISKFSNRGLTDKNNNKREQRYAQRTASMFFIERENQRQNLDRLDKALENEQIDAEIHEKTVSLIKKTMDLPRLRLVHLVQRYVAHVKMQLIKQVLKAALVRYKKNIRLTDYVNEMQRRIESKNKKWEARKTELVEYRATILLQLMQAFSAVKTETGLLLIEPMCKSQRKPILTNRNRNESFLPKLGKQIHTVMEETIVGKSLKPLEDKSCTIWQQPDLSSDANPLVTMPRILDLDINRWKYTAKSTLLKNANEIHSTELCKTRMEKIKMAYASKLTLPPIASIYPENPPE